MAVTKLNPRTIHLAGPKIIVNDVHAGEAITPGHLIEMYDDSGTTKWRKHATGTEMVSLCVALEQSEMNLGIDDDYADEDLVVAAFLAPGSVFYGLIASGQDISNAELLHSAGAGLVATATTTTEDGGRAHFQSLTNAGAVTTLTRIRVQVIA